MPRPNIKRRVLHHPPCTHTHSPVRSLCMIAEPTLITSIANQSKLSLVCVCRLHNTNRTRASHKDVVQGVAYANYAEQIRKLNPATLATMSRTRPRTQTRTRPKATVITSQSSFRGTSQCAPLRDALGARG